MGECTREEWQHFIGARPNAHVLQTAEWGDLKSAFGWEPVRIIVGGGGAQVLVRSLPLGFSIAYVPRPPGDNSAGATASSVLENAAFLEALNATCRRRKAIFCRVEPDLTEATRRPDVPGADWRKGIPIQPRRTIVVDLHGSEAGILARMNQKHRYNVRLAERKGVRVRPWSDLDAFHSMMTITGRRDGFAVHSREYYRRAYELFQPPGLCELLVAEFEGRPLAALMVFHHGNRAWFLYGASSDQHRNLMPTYLLQWEAMRWARGRGCETYDLWGVPDADETVLEANFEKRSDGLWGVYRFKRGFGGAVRRAPDPLDLVFHRPLYAVYARLSAGGAGAA